MFKNLISTIVISLITIFYTNISMALEETNYKIIKSIQNYEIRKYSDRLAVEVEFS